MTNTNKNTNIIYYTKCKNELSPQNTFCPICGKINTNNHPNDNNVKIIENSTNEINNIPNKLENNKENLEENGSTESIISVALFTIVFLPYYLFVFLGPLLGSLLFGNDASGRHLAVMIFGMLISIPTLCVLY